MKRGKHFLYVRVVDSNNINDIEIVRAKMYFEGMRNVSIEQEGPNYVDIKGWCDYMITAENTKRCLDEYLGLVSV